MTDTIQLAKECGAIELAIESAFDLDLTAYVVTNKELEAFRKRVEDEMKEKCAVELTTNSNMTYSQGRIAAEIIRSMK